MIINLLILVAGFVVGVLVMSVYLKVEYNKGYRDCWEIAYTSGYQDAFRLVREGKRK